MQNAVHMGLPIKNIGFSLAMRRRASSRRSGMLKSQAFPCSSAVVRSRARPGTMQNSGNIFAIAVTLGGLYTSESAQPARCIQLERCFCFNTYFFLLPPKRSMRFRMLLSTLQSPPGSSNPMSLHS